jgi:tetratricopeptide (TPR) repeat protein
MSASEVRRAALSPRSTQLLVTEIQGLETLIADTPKNSPDRPGLIRRVADDYLELEAGARRDKTLAQMKKDSAAEAKNAKNESSARQAAIKHLERLKKEHPGYCRVSQPKASGCVDDVLYDLAFEYEEDKQPDKARAVYLDLIKTAPSSPHIPQAYLAFGELYFQEAQGDPSKWTLAEQAYREVLKYPAPQNKTLGYAQYKLAYIAWNKGDYAQALTGMKRTIEVAMSDSTVPGAAGLLASARRDLIPIYAVSGEARKAAALLSPLVGGDSKLPQALADLGLAYLDTGHYQDAIELFHDLTRKDRPHACSHQAHAVDAMLAWKSADKAAITTELNALAELEQATKGEEAPTCANKTAELLSETAMAWHLEAVGSGGVRGTGDAKTLEAATGLYERVIARFSAKDFASFTFPRIVKEDWPTREKLAYLLADLTYARKDWAKCGPAFDAVVAAAPDGPLAGESAFTSAVCYQNLFHAAHAGGRDRARLADASKAGAGRELTSDEKTMVGSFDRFLCVAKALPTDKDLEEHVVDVAFARARTYFEAERWEEAASAFRTIAIEHPKSDAATAAAELSLEAENVRLQHGIPACRSAMGEDDAKYVALFCKGDARKGNDEACVRFERVGREIERSAIEDLVKDADAHGDTARLEQAGDRYLAIWNGYGAAACENKKPDCARMEEVLSNAARTYQAARLVAKAIGVRKILIDPRFHLERTELARKAVREIGANYQAIAVYDEAARWLEQYGKENASMDKAAESLEDAVVLWIGLGEEEKARAAALAFEKTFGSKKAALAAQIAFAEGSHLLDRGETAKAKRRLSEAMPLIDRAATYDVAAAAHALLGRAINASGGRGDTELAKVRSMFRSPETAYKKIELAAGGDKDDLERRLRRALNAWGEAIYASGEEKRRAVDAIKFPEYKGAGRREEVERFVKNELASWMKKKQPAIEAAEKEYSAVLSIATGASGATTRPSPPPEWVIASGARVGSMWSKFVAEFRAAPIPAEWKQSGMSPAGVPWEEIRQAYYEAIDRASEPYKVRAKAAMNKCLEYAVTYQHFDEHAKSCERWLAKTYPTEFHAIDELRVAPARPSAKVLALPAQLPRLASNPDH